MTEILREDEGIPASYPPTPSGLSAGAAALDPAVIWGRIEQWCDTRWSARSIEWIVSGLGYFEPPLAPATIATVETWRGDVWEALTPSPSPLGGFVLSCAGPYRFTGTVGAGPVPAAADEAYRRLAEYLAKTKSLTPGLARVESGELSLEIDRPSTITARAIHNSGAADLLRPWHRIVR